MNLYYKLLYLFLDKDIYTKYKSTIDLNNLRHSHPMIYKLFLSLFKVHETLTNKEQASLEDLIVAYASLYPNDTPSETEVSYRRIREEGSLAKKEMLLQYLEESKTRITAYEVAKLGLEVAEGAKPPEALKGALELALQSFSEESFDSWNFVTDDLNILYNEEIKNRGLRWRLESLNKSLGSLRRGDFGFIFARPETGKTTFLASEVTFMATQTNGQILWVNNEEQGEKVMLRCYQAALNLTTKELITNLEENKRKFDEIIGHRIKIYDNTEINKSEIEELIASLNPSLIVIDQIDKIKGFDDDRKDLELGSIYQWGREIAKRYCPTIGICQADGTGEGVKALTMAHVSNAKTSKQAEADFILGIGKSSNRDEQFIRYFNVSKNKLIGDEDSDPNLRHDYWEVEIDPNRARYKDFQYHDDYNNS